MFVFLLYVLFLWINENKYKKEHYASTDKRPAFVLTIVTAYPESHDQNLATCMNFWWLQHLGVVWSLIYNLARWLPTNGGSQDLFKNNVVHLTTAMIRLTVMAKRLWNEAWLKHLLSKRDSGLNCCNLRTTCIPCFKPSPSQKNSSDDISVAISFFKMISQNKAKMCHTLRLKEPGWHWTDQSCFFVVALLAVTTIWPDWLHSVGNRKIKSSEIFREGMTFVASFPG